MLTTEEKIERDPVAIQRELLELAEYSAQLADEQVEIEREYHEKLQAKKIAESKQKWIKQRISALQSVLRSLR